MDSLRSGVAKKVSGRRQRGPHPRRTSPVRHTVGGVKTKITRAAALSAVLLTACGGSSTPGPDAAPQVQPGTTLLGSVGTDDDPEAFEIALTTEGGDPVDVVAAGSYTLVVDDPSQIHNFHLTGQGVDVETEISGTGKKTFEVTFSAGEYGYVCDPHPSMSGTLRAV